jgi:hypothetical protein
MPLYTFVTDKEGGTYIEQFRGSCVVEGSLDRPLVEVMALQAMCR